MARVVALTGGLGAGKSTALSFCAKRGATIIQSDALASHLMDTDPAIQQKLIYAFGDSVVREGVVDRTELTRHAFSSREAAARLNAIVHPYVLDEIRARIKSFREEPSRDGSTEFLSEPTLIIEIPLLAEVPQLIEEFDEVLTICASVPVRVARVVARGMDREDAEKRIEAQASDDERIAIAHSVIYNNDGKQAFETELERWWSSGSGSKTA